ncbi:hypothetical protein B0H19DRAFT_87464 [Mycena capillaripes]|nr:hypothetical protein B0H19DRAFT_87464 [Mycena capillaripes]
MEPMDTPYKDILHTNAVPTDADCERIRELLVGPRKEVADLAAEIERLQTLINQLSEKRDHLNDFIDPHLALISPTRRLPEDVVTEIFTACLPADRNAIMSSAEAPLLLCHVCREWRNLAISTPRLWASLHIIAYGNVSKLQQINEATNMWLSRSGVLPLSISIVDYVDVKPLTDCSVLVETLVRFSSRWSQLRFKLNAHSFLKPMTALSPADVPILGTLIANAFSSGAGEWRRSTGTECLCLEPSAFEISPLRVFGKLSHFLFLGIDFAASSLAWSQAHNSHRQMDSSCCGGVPISRYVPFPSSQRRTSPPP